MPALQKNNLGNLQIQDAQVRAIKLADNDKVISYEDFVALTLSTNQSITW